MTQRFKWPALALAKYFSAVALIWALASTSIGSMAARAGSVPNGVGKRKVTVEDIARLRQGHSLAVSPAGSMFVVLVARPNPATNRYESAWYLGRLTNRRLSTYVRLADGGELVPSRYSDGQENGELAASAARWSPDGRFIAFWSRSKGAVDLQIADAFTREVRQVSDTGADVRDFAWGEKAVLYFSTGGSRADLAAREESRFRNGYQYDEELSVFTVAFRRPPPEPDNSPDRIWVVRNEKKPIAASPAEAAEYHRLRAGADSGEAAFGSFYADAAIPPVVSSDGAAAWLERRKPASPILKLVARTAAGQLLRCAARECEGIIERLWWTSDGEKIGYWRHEGVNDEANGFYQWTPGSPKVRKIISAPDDQLMECSAAAADVLLCLRSTKTLPPHLALLDLRSGKIQRLVDFNPEFANIRLGRVERIEWDTPYFAWNAPGGKYEGLYPRRAYGYILYPPNFDPSRKYPVIISPYVASGFNTPEREHAIQAYAAAGFVVLNLSFPMPTPEALEHFGGRLTRILYAEEDDYPDMQMLSESTFRALDLLEAKGFVDADRVGIGGISTGTFVPLYMVQTSKQIAAISIGTQYWSYFQYYWPTARARKAVEEAYGKVGFESPFVSPEGEGRSFWSGIDIADHVDDVSTPILINVADREVFALVRLIRLLGDAHRPYDAYVYNGETHLKWQPAHLKSAMARNLDWFRFWLQGSEDEESGKRAQYARWEHLCELQRAAWPQRPTACVESH